MGRVMVHWLDPSTVQAREGVVSDINQIYFRILLQYALSNPESVTELPEEVRSALKDCTGTNRSLPQDVSERPQARYW
jgi:hypothetical protein